MDRRLMDSAEQMEQLQSPEVAVHPQTRVSKPRQDLGGLAIGTFGTNPDGPVARYRSGPVGPLDAAHCPTPIGPLRYRNDEENEKEDDEPQTRHIMTAGAVCRALTLRKVRQLQGQVQFILRKGRQLQGPAQENQKTGRCRLMK
ncbi:hypothetical protein NQZ68_000704 [Dissostichus eleginoides]|nr:hypothetical protein NQZ68_000704 [Dissostichus eleginoides]